MANFDIPEDASFNPTLRKLERADPADAVLFNTMFGQLLENEVYLNMVAQKMAELLAQKTKVEIGETEPEDGPVLWFNTGYKQTEPEPETVLMLDLGDLTEDSVVQANIDGTDYAVLNASDPVEVDDGISIEII